MEDQDKINDILQRLETGTCTPQELEWLDNWYHKGTTGRGQVFPDSSYQQHLEKELLHAIHAQLPEPAKVIPLRRWWRVAAAVMVIIMLGSGYYFINDWRLRHHMLTVEVGAGDIVAIVLPDSTHVWLNAGAKFQYPEKFGKVRTVVLEGQGFFDVKADAQHPFEVKTGELQVQVLGTSFDVKAYAALDEASVTVKTGMVKVLHRNEGLDVLSAGDQLIFSRPARQYMKTKVDNQQINEWASGIISLSQAGFAEVALTLENQYGVRIRYNPAEMKQGEYTLRCSKKLTIAQVLDLLSGIHPMQYDINGTDISVHRKQH